ncbi:glycosyltransferase [Chitinophaga sp. CB10]|uniref:glycosyltransferase family 2 protein n=1 Tax=Chitinophaga sp. CB10 TaxID=1891659 RepID=UPI0025BA3742|nr:glycosyltransferase [Chitinophaga sp. CB10]
MENPLKISVVVPSYKRPELLSRCLQALAFQEFKENEYEVIVVSDGPDDVTRKVTENWQQLTNMQLRYYELPEKKGPAAARNLGWKHANAKLIAFTDDDCIPDSQWLLHYWTAFKNDDTAQAFTGKVVVPLPQREQCTDHALNLSHLSTAEFITANCACNATAMELCGGFDERFRMAWREDSDLEFKLLKANIQIKYVPRAMVEHPVNKAPWGVSMRDQRKGVYNALLYSKYPDLYKVRVRQKPRPLYYLMCLSLLGALVLLPFHPQQSALLFLIWVICWLSFTMQRLEKTSRSASHVLEMLVTSAAIPFLSIYWHFYGNIRYKTFFV